MPQLDIAKERVFSRLGKAFALVAALALSFSLVLAAPAQAASLQDRAAQAQDKAAACIVEGTTGSTQVGFTFEWKVLGLARSGYSVPANYYETYYASLVGTLKEKSGVLSNKATDYSRVVLCLSALGYDPRNVNGYDLLTPLSDLAFVRSQGNNSVMRALQAFDSKDYAIPPATGDAQALTREVMVEDILATQADSGAWGVASFKNGAWSKPSRVDADMTAMAIQALTPYYSQSDDVKAAVDRGIAWLSEHQNTDGSFSNSGSANPESCAQVIVALCGLGVDPGTDVRFVKNGANAVDAMLGYQLSAGGFCHVKGFKEDALATEQSFYALVAYSRLLKGENPLFLMGDGYQAQVPTLSAYEVKYVEKSSKKVLDKKSVSSVAVGSVVTEKAIAIKGYELVSGSASKSLSIQKDAAKNVITFYYTKASSSSGNSSSTSKPSSSSGSGSSSSGSSAGSTGAVRPPYHQSTIRPSSISTKSEVDDDATEHSGGEFFVEGEDFEEASLSPEEYLTSLREGATGDELSEKIKGSAPATLSLSEAEGEGGLAALSRSQLVALLCALAGIVILLAVLARAFVKHR